LFNLLEIILNKSGTVHETQQEAIDYATEHTVDKSVVMTVAGATKCKIDYNALERKGDADMCTVFEETRKEGVIEGRVEGRTEGRAEEIIAMGYEFGLSENDILKKLQSKLQVSSQKAQEYLEQFGKTARV
jgi:hypothetical protein